jgi:BTB/POZ domain
MAESVLRNRSVIRRVVVDIGGHDYFETTFCLTGEELSEPLVPAGADKSTSSSRHAAQIGDSLPQRPNRGYCSSGNTGVTYHYSNYQKHAGFQWRICVCVRQDSAYGKCSDVSLSLECGGATPDVPSSRDDSFELKARVWLQFFRSLSPSTPLSSFHHAMIPLDHMFDRRSPSVWTAKFCPSCSWHSSASAKTSHDSNCWYSSVDRSQGITSATIVSANVLLYPHEVALARDGNNTLKKSDDQRWFHPLDMLEDPENSSADVVLQSRDDSVIRAHRCVLGSYDFFKVLLSSGFKEASAGTARLSDLSEQGMRLMVDWVYGAGLPPSLGQDAALLVELWVFASVHNMSDMAQSCRSIALSMAREDNFTLLFSTAMKLADKNTARKLTSAVSGSVDQIIDWIGGGE